MSAAPQPEMDDVRPLAGADIVALVPPPEAAEVVARPLAGDRARAAAKRAIDITGAGLLLIALAPLFALIALLIVLDSPGPVFYRAERVGHGGRRLRMLKFRKMHAHATGGLLTVANDARLTRVGAWLVRGKLDELPQLWHVLRGDMSLVGPRPECPDYVARFAAEYEEILRVRPGMTGLTQLAFACEGRILDPGDPGAHYLRALLPQKVMLDRLYARRPSVRRDLEILLATLVTLGLRRPIAVNRATGALTPRRRPARRVGAAR